VGGQIRPLQTLGTMISATRPEDAAKNGTPFFA
jgi:hypothetical protein